MYGAMGLCQFMPSSIEPYGADGNDDGVIDFFLVDDAVASLSNYLQKNGWKPGLSRAARHTVLRRYNRQDMYANTILGLADMIRGVPVGKPVFSSPPKNRPGKKPAVSGKGGKPPPPKKTSPPKKPSPAKTPSSGKTAPPKTQAR
jgi:membrane-bound lytic murein transglycosylase B